MFLIHGNKNLRVDPGLKDTTVLSVNQAWQHTAIYEEHKEKKCLGEAQTRQPWKRVLGLAHCYPASCQETFSNSTMLNANSDFNLCFSVLCIFYFCHLPRILISLCWNVGSGLLKITLQRKEAGWVLWLQWVKNVDISVPCSSRVCFPPTSLS